ncbi:hypothetical protein SEUCBS139899_008006 [Sporothrix eucalyptigena]|uniref:SET domain-containing protein n=1 Tax=Sporothrix eucalyptigena TaxID=1812306 RepID=A0ABP0C065_9PEZI
MGIDTGFDIFPPLEQTPENQARYERFIHHVLTVYKRSLDDYANVDDKTARLNDKKANRSFKPHPSIICINPADEMSYIEFCVGEHPRIPRHCENFLRFSSETSGSSRAAEHICVVTSIAKVHFDDRVYSWSDVYNGATYIQHAGCYSWIEVRNAEKRANAKEKAEAKNNDSADSQDKAETSPNKTTAATDKPLYEVVPVEGKGKGVVARVDIPKGTRIMREKPLIAFPGGYSSIDEAEAVILRAVRSLTRDQQRAFFSLHNSKVNENKFDPFFMAPISPILGIFMTNALPVGEDGDGGLFLEVARINHACRPNTKHVWNPQLECMTIHALEDIPRGAEITISYIDSTTMTYAERKDHFPDHFNFVCRCPGLCGRSPLRILESDMRLDMIDRLTAKACVLKNMQKDPAQTLQVLHDLCHLLHEERLRSNRLSSTYVLAANAAAAIQDKARTSAFAQLAYATCETIYGEDHPATAKAKRLAERPVENEYYGTSEVIAHPVGWEPPKGLSAEAFNAWLWDTSSWTSS